MNVCFRIGTRLMAKAKKRQTVRLLRHWRRRSRQFETSMLMVGLLRRFVRFYIYVLQQIRRVVNGNNSMQNTDSSSIMKYEHGQIR